jgi:hypothetical protein
VLQGYERSRGLVHSVSLGNTSVSWLLDTTRTLLQLEHSKEFVKSWRVGIKSWRLCDYPRK